MICNNGMGVIICPLAIWRLANAPLPIQKVLPKELNKLNPQRELDKTDQNLPA